MKAAYYESFRGAISIEQVPDPKPVPDGVVIEVKATGLCLSDWHGWMGHDPDITLPHVPGHELAGVIVALGREVSNWKIGDRVTLPFVCGCGQCPTCKSGDPQVCPDQFQPGFTHWGSFAEYVSIHYATTNLVRLPEEISYATAASLGCRFATSYRAVCQQAVVKEGEIVALFGCGGVGLSAISIAQAKGARVIAIDPKIEALRHARKMGASELIQATDEKEVAREIRAISGGGVHVTIDAIGNQEVIRQAFQSLRRRGRHVQVGLLAPGKTKVSIPMDRVIAYELEIYGSHGMAALHYDEMIRLILDGRLKPELLITREIDLQQAVDTLPLLNQQQQGGISVITSF